MSLLTSTLMKWNETALGLFLQLQKSHLAGIQESFTNSSLMSFQSQFDEDKLQELVSGIETDQRTIRESLMKLLGTMDINAFVRVKEPGQDTSANVVVKMGELSLFMSQLDPDAEVKWWPSHFGSYLECEEWVNERLKLSGNGKES